MVAEKKERRPEKKALEKELGTKRERRGNQDGENIIMSWRIVSEDTSLFPRRNSTAIMIPHHLLNHPRPTGNHSFSYPGTPNGTFFQREFKKKQLGFIVAHSRPLMGFLLRSRGALYQPHGPIIPT